MVGLSAGIAAVTLKLFAHFLRNYFVEGYLNIQSFPYSYVFLPVIGFVLTAFIIQKFYKGKLKKGIAYILHAIAKKSSLLPFHHMWAHIITSGITVGFGGSVGMESPIVNTGSAIGSNFARRYKLTYKERTLMLASGVAGGVAGAFNAPIAGVLFALEVLLVEISLSAFIPLLIASASGALISNILLNEHILLNFKNIQSFNYKNVPFYILLALLSAFISLYYVNTFNKVTERFSKIPSVTKRIAIGSVLFILLLLVFPSFFGEGYESIKHLSEFKFELDFLGTLLKPLMGNKWAILFILVLTLLLKSFAASITVGVGGNGGNFAPSLFVGAHLGFAFSYLLHLLGFESVPMVNFTLVSMAGVLCGVFHSPLTAIFLIAEITGGYELMIPLMIVSSISYVVVKYFHPDSENVVELRKQGTVVSEHKDISTLSKIELKPLIETDFIIVKPEETLGQIVEKVKQSPRSLFPVVNKDEKLIGIITLSSIKTEMFNKDLYTKLIAKELMVKPEFVIDEKDDIFSVMKKFDESGRWNLPVLEKGSYIGFLSKSGILAAYREHVLSSI
ncbi:MAG: chloride channel protein [Bacteroidia bacterium]